MILDPINYFIFQEPTWFDKIKYFEVGTLKSLPDN